MKKITIFFTIIFLISCNPSFDQIKWKADKTSRQEQVKSIIKSEILIGKSYNEMVDLLGEHDVEYRHESVGLLTDSLLNLIVEGKVSGINYEIQYIVGTCIMGFDRLTITFEANKVTKVDRYCD